MYANGVYPPTSPVSPLSSSTYHTSEMCFPFPFSFLFALEKKIIDSFVYFGKTRLFHFCQSIRFTALFTIDPPAFYEGRMPRRQQQIILGWAEVHQQELMDNWNQARLGMPMVRIEGRI
ncbi:MAG: DUF4160 domain-containing protein [Chloroflexi bacterium]|nr:MAG: DUF4160 domain-containing protein [Chloroflexota bacterium]